jgi:UDP-N-acetylglucosamine diphosphorylase/glucosamine-1-phosphate N-acetyltransferase
MAYKMVLKKDFCKKYTILTKLVFCKKKGIFMNYILFDDINRNHLLPLTFMRPVADIRCGILKISEKWEKHLNSNVTYFTVNYLRKKFPIQTAEINVFINGSLLPDSEIIKSIYTLDAGQKLLDIDNNLLAFVISGDNFDSLHLMENNEILLENLDSFDSIVFEGCASMIKRSWDIFSMNGEALISDYELLTRGRKSQPISGTNRVKGQSQIFIEEGAVVEFSIINAESGPVYIGKNAEIMENCAVRGPFALCEESTLKMGAKIYGPTTIGPHCKVGGEVNNSVFFGFSNKAHDGFLGNAVIAEWCNLGADSNNSNLKNTYEIVKLWSYPEKHFVSTGLQFCGLIMGDHSKCGINTMFNTGTVVGINCNIYGEGFPRNYIPSFSWGGASGFKKFNFNKAMQVAQAVFERRGVILSDTDIEIFETLYALSE